MKKMIDIFSVLLFQSVLLIPGGCNSQNATTSNPDYSIYNLAVENSDYQTAVQHLYSLIAKDNENTSLWDSLSTCYFRMKGYEQCIKTSEKVLSADSFNLRILGMKAVSEQMLGKEESALATYQQLFKITRKVQHLYQISELNFLLRRYEDCLKTSEELLSVSNSSSEKVQLYFEDSIKNTTTQSVLLEAAAYNLMGMALFQQSKKEEAREAFETALIKAPGFKLAEGNLAAIYHKN